MILSFDHKEFWSKCTPHTKTFDVRYGDIGDIDMVLSSIFNDGSVWKNRTLVRSTLDCITSVQMWTACQDRDSLRCNRFGKKRIEVSIKDKKYKSGHLKLGCLYQLKLFPLYKTMVRKAVSSSSNASPHWDKPVKIANAVISQLSGCTPCVGNRFNTAS